MAEMHHILLSNHQILCVCVCVCVCVSTEIFALRQCIVPSIGSNLYSGQQTDKDALNYISTTCFDLIGPHQAVIQGYSKVPPGFPNSTAQQPRKTRQKGAYQ